MSDKLGSASITVYRFQTLDISFFCWRSMSSPNKTRVRSRQVSFKVFYDVVSLSLKVSAELKFNIHCFSKWSRSGWGGACSSRFIFRLDVAHSIVDCTLSCFFVLCTKLPVMLSLSIYLMLCTSFFGVFIRGSLSLSYFEWIFIPSSSCFSFSLFSFCSLFVFILGVKVDAFTAPFSNIFFPPECALKLRD